MKQNASLLVRLLLILLVVLLPLSITSCFSYSTLLDMYGITTGDTESVTDPTDNTTETDQKPEETLPPLSDNFETGAVTEGEDDHVDIGTSEVTGAASMGLRSAVSVYATFKATNFWGNTVSGTSAGAGVIYKLDPTTGSAFIITNYHVVYNTSSNTANGVSDDISIFLYGMEGTAYAIPATYIGGSMHYDIAVLYVNNDRTLKSAAERGAATAITLADSDAVSAGQTAIAIGNPESAGISVTTGIVSVDSEYITMTAVDGRTQVSFRVIRIDTAVNSGNSGGGLFDAKGKLIGIVNAKVTSSDVENIGYAIPSNVARAIADNIIDYCYNQDCETVMRGLLGIKVEISALTTSYDPETGVFSRYEQVRVAEVSEGGLGEKMLKAGDVVVSVKIGDKEVNVTRQYHLIDAMLDVRVGDTVEMTVERDGKTETVQTVITEDCLAPY